ncbi:MAG: hypothetical protein IJE07_04850 [Clostridia bacterium]|nr:hypothetical protein [Clostridia bacterium]
MERLLRYSLEHERVIRLMLLTEGSLTQVNARIIAYDAEKIEFITTRSPRPQTALRADVLAADFRRGDDGQV